MSRTDLKYLCILFLVLSPSIECNCQPLQQFDSAENRPSKTSWGREIVVPAALILIGSISAVNQTLINRYEIAEERDETAPYFHTKVDNFLQFAPVVAVYALNTAGMKGEHDFANRTALLLKSELIMAAIVYPLKKFTAVPRPDTGAPNSFPSGHAAQAFAAATFLHKEFGKVHPLYSVLAFGTATGVGVLRVMNNRHWASDVIVGAGIGILSTNLAYITHHDRWGKKHKHFSGLMASPTYSHRSYGLYLSLPIR